MALFTKYDEKFLGADYEIIINSFAHFKPSVIGEVKLTPVFIFSPIFPAVLQDLYVVLLAELVLVPPGDPAHAVLVEAWGVRGAIGNVKPVDLTI